MIRVAANIIIIPTKHAPRKKLNIGSSQIRKKQATPSLAKKCSFKNELFYQHLFVVYNRC
jgi:hypothetical protein